MTFSPGPASFIRGPKSASPSGTRGGSRVPEWGPLGSVRGALSNERPYRDLRNVDANYPFERSHRLAEIQPNSGFGGYSRLSCGVGDTQLRGRPDSRQDASTRYAFACSSMDITRFKICEQICHPIDEGLLVVNVVEGARKPHRIAGVIPLVELLAPGK